MLAKLLRDQRGEVILDEGVITGQSDWRPYIPDDVKADASLSKVVENAQEKDISSLVKSWAHYEHGKGSSLRLPGKDATEDDVKSFKSKVFETGHFKTGPEKPEGYQITKPSEDVLWDQNLENSFRGILHKHGASQELANDIYGLYTDIFKATDSVLKATEEEGMNVLKTEHGDKFEERFQVGKRLAQSIFKTDDEAAYFDQHNMGNDPRFLGPLMRLAPLAMMDSSFMDSLKPVTDGASTIEEAHKEHNAIMLDPNHPKYAAYRGTDPIAKEDVMKYIESLYAPVAGDQKIII